MTLIGLSFQTENCMEDSFGMKQRYVDYLDSVGLASCVLIPGRYDDHIEQVLERVDGVMITGGSNVAPSLYGEPLRGDKKELSPRRDDYEMKLVLECIVRDIPVLAICRGLQITNVALGGTLYQDVASEQPTVIKHWDYDNATNPANPAHKISVVEDGLLAPIAMEAGGLSQNVNSVHNQGIKILSTRMKKEAITEDGLIEAASVNECSFFLAIQWHPSFVIEEPFSQAIINAFKSACLSYRSKS